MMMFRSNNTISFGRGWVDPYSWDFVDEVQSQLSIVRKELLAMTQSHQMTAQTLGYGPRNWISKELNLPEISNCVENWIREGGFHSEQIGYDSRKSGEWQTLPLFKADLPQAEALASRYLPNTLKMLNHIPNLQFSAIFKQPPDAEIAVHRHSQNRRIFHFLLHSLEGGQAWIQVGNERRQMSQQGDCLAFDVRTPHGSGNNSTTDRINLVLDLAMSTD